MLIKWGIRVKPPIQKIPGWSVEVPHPQEGEHGILTPKIHGAFLPGQDEWKGWKKRK